MCALGAMVVALLHGWKKERERGRRMARGGAGRMMRGLGRNGQLEEGARRHLEEEEVGMLVLVHEDDALNSAAHSLPLVLLLHS
jgi:hypothetical protein